MSQLEGEVVVSEVVEGAAHEVPVAEEELLVLRKSLRRRTECQEGEVKLGIWWKF